MLQRLYGGKNRTPYTKDAFHDHIIPQHRPAEPEPEKSESSGLPVKSPSRKSPRLPPHHTPAEIDGQDGEEGEGEETDGERTPKQDNGENGETNGEPLTAEAPPRPRSETGGRVFVNPEKTGTKAAAHYVFNAVPGKGGCVVVRMKMTPNSTEQDPSIIDEELFDDNVEERRMDSDEFYARIAGGSISDDLRNIMRQALSGMLWWVVRDFVDVEPGEAERSLQDETVLPVHSERMDGWGPWTATTSS